MVWFDVQYRTMLWFHIQHRSMVWFDGLYHFDQAALGGGPARDELQHVDAPIAVCVCVCVFRGRGGGDAGENVCRCMYVGGVCARVRACVRARVCVRPRVCDCVVVFLVLIICDCASDCIFV